MTADKRMAYFGIETVDKSQADDLLGDFTIRYRDDGRGQQTLAWMYDSERAARIRRVFGLIIETGWGTPVPILYPTYFLDLAQSDGAGCFVYSARWDTTEEDSTVARFRHGHSIFWAMSDQEHQNHKTPNDIFATYDARGYCETSAGEDTERLEPHIYSARGFIKIVKSAQRELQQLEQ